MAIHRKHRRTLAAVAAGAAAAGLLVACQTVDDRRRPPLALAAHVDLPRFMGDWYVIASIPTVLEAGAHAAKETYRLLDDGSVDTTFTYRAGAFDGPLRTLRSRGFVLSPSGAVWGQQYVWPIRADYRISFVAADYGTTVIAREKRDHVWIMARTPTVDDATYRRLVEIVAEQGYDVARLQRVPQQPPPP